MDADLKQLSDNWGNSSICLDHPWVDTSGLPTSIDELEETLRRIPQEKIYVRIPGETPNAGTLPRVDLCNPGELDQRLKEGHLHILGMGLEKVSEPFRNFIDSFIDRISPVLSRYGVEKSVDASLVIFISSANCIVPYHSDPEHNFLFQIVGDKKFHIFPNTDLELFPAVCRERMFCQTRGYIMPFQDNFQMKATTLYLKPGSSTYQPPSAPHWIDTGNAVSVSVTLSIFTPALERLRLLHKVNSYLRKLHINPSRVDENPWRDHIKSVIARPLQYGKQKLKGQNPRRSHYS